MKDQRSRVKDRLKSFWILDLVVGICFGFLILSLGSQVWAFPQVFPSSAINGPSGVVRIPSADVIPYKNFNLAADYGMREVPSTSDTPESDTPEYEQSIFYKMNLGAYHGLELGIVGGTEDVSENIREGVFVNMKLSLSSGEDSDPMLFAIGVENLFSYTKTDVYMVATKYFQLGPRLTFGFMADFPENKFRPLGIAGLEVPVGDTLYLTSDLLAGEILFQFNSGLRFYLTPIFSFTVSALNIFDGVDAKDSRSALAGFTWANPF
jgi:hypothetical protein